MSSESIQPEENQTKVVNHQLETENVVNQPEVLHHQTEIPTDETSSKVEVDCVDTDQAVITDGIDKNVPLEKDTVSDETTTVTEKPENIVVDEKQDNVVDYEKEEQEENISVVDEKESTEVRNVKNTILCKEENAEVEVQEISADEELEEPSSAETVSSQDQKPTTSKRIYIANVHYNTTEDEIAILFKNYEIVSIIIPHYTIRLFRYKQKPMGIAYVDFKTHEQASKAINEFHGHELNGRQLRIKFYYPYIPYSKRDPIKTENDNLENPEKSNSSIEDNNIPSKSNSAISSISSKKKNKSKKRKYLKKDENQSETDIIEPYGIANANELDEEICEQKEELQSENENKDLPEVEAIKQDFNNNTNESSNAFSSYKTKFEKISQKVEYSKDTIYISKLQAKTTDVDLRKFFEEFEPSDIYIFKGKYYHRPFRFGQRHMCALITLAAKDGQRNALKKLQNEKLNGKFLKLYPAFNSKVEEIKKLVSEKHEELNEAQRMEKIPVESKNDNTQNDQKDLLESKNSGIEQHQYEEDDEEDEGEESHIIITEAQPIAA